MSAGQGHDRLLREIQADGHIIDLSNSQIKSKCSIPAMKLIRKDISHPPLLQSVAVPVFRSKSRMSLMKWGLESLNFGILL